MPPPDRLKPRVGIVDYGMGNLFSVQRACEWAGLDALITADPDSLRACDGLILPGVGAFGDAMASLISLGLVDLLRETAASEKPFLGICLGMQLLMTGSREFGLHRGLDVLEGEVVPLSESGESGGKVKVPQVGWNQIAPPSGSSWESSCLRGLREGSSMYFVHSFYVQPVRPDLTVATTCYGATTFCSAVRRGNLFACQFHPERSGPQGLKIYRNFAGELASRSLEGARP